MRPRVPTIKTPDWERIAAGAINHALSELESKQTAIADDASGAVNQATVNAILTALRAKGIIET